jgi:hypothetical protein
MSLMLTTVRHADGYEQTYPSPYPDHTPQAAYAYMLAVLTSTGLHPTGDPDALTVTTHTPTVRVTRQFIGGDA